MGGGPASRKRTNSGDIPASSPRSENGKPLTTVCGGQSGCLSANSCENIARTSDGEYRPSNSGFSDVGGRSNLGPQTVPRLSPGAATPLCQPEQETVKGRTEKPELRQERDLRQHGRIVSREEAQGLEETGRPGNTFLLGHQPGGVREHVGNQEVRPSCGRQDVFVGFPEDRHQEFTDDVFAALARIHDAPHRVTVGVQVGAVRAHGVEADAPRLDPLSVVAGGGDDRFVSSGLQTQGDGDVGMQVAQGAERREDDLAPRLTRFPFACWSAFSHSRLRYIGLTSHCTAKCCATCRHRTRANLS